MINQLLCFSFLGNIADAIVTSIILIAIVICVVIMLKNKESRIFLMYVIGAIIIAVGILSTIGLVKELKAESYVNGSIDIPTNTEQVLNYSATNLTLYDDPNDNLSIYSYSTTLPSTTFDGNEYRYNVSLNEYQLIDITIGAGYIYAVATMSFYNVNGDLQCEAIINISILFLSNETQLQISVEGTEQSEYIEQYFNDNGIRLLVERR